MISSSITIVLVGILRILVEALAFRINFDAGFQVVETADDADEGLKIILKTQPDIAILDTELPGRGVFDIASEITSRQKRTKIVFLTAGTSDIIIDQALRVRASGLLTPDEPIETLLANLKRIAGGSHCFPKEVEERLEFDAKQKRYKFHSDSSLSLLTNRQIEVLRHLARGLSVKEVAKRMHLSQKSVDSHKYRIMHKLNIHDRVELSRYTIREGLILP